MRIDVSSELEICVKRLNGMVLDEVLPEPRFANNADYWFPEQQVVAELKCLTEDLAIDTAFKDVLNALYVSWVQRRLIVQGAKGTVRLNLRNLPPQCGRELISKVQRKLESSTIRKANRQLRDTKNYFSAPQAKGLLLLVNDGNSILTPAMVGYLLANMLKGQYSSIDSVIYFSVNEFCTVPGADPSPFWMDIKVPNRVPVSPDFRRAFFDTWIDHLRRITSAPVSVMPMDGVGADFIDNMQFTSRQGQSEKRGTVAD